INSLLHRRRLHLSEVKKSLVLTVLRDPQAGAPGLLSVPYSTLTGASVPRLVRSALSALRDENLCIIRASRGTE
ncbi:MAG: hypothetical protein V3T61_09150, partial [Acidobacteriota bacterium]